MASPERPHKFADLRPDPPPAEVEPGEAVQRSDAAPLLPSKPPLREEDGLVEVGWDGDLESEFPPSGASAPAQPALVDDQTLNEELIEDQYAALESWAGWPRNHGRTPDESPSPASLQPLALGPAPGEHHVKSAQDPAVAADSFDHVASVPVAEMRDPNSPPESADPAADLGRAAAIPPAGFRAEGQHEFAPYSHLFNRLKAKG
jgi:general secretion pathway protein A